MSIAATNAWKRRKFELEGLCLNCNQRPANDEGGTRTTCAICAEKKRINERNRQERLHPGRLPVHRVKRRKQPTILKPEKKFIFVKAKPEKIVPVPKKQIQAARIDLMCKLAERLNALDKLRA